MEGKKSLSIDLKSLEGRAIVHRIIKSADVFVLGFRSGVAERVGLDYETLRAINPRLVYVHSSGYGPDGPYANRPMYAQTASATVGAFQRNSPYWMDPDVIGDFGVPELEALVAPRVRGPSDGDGNAALAVCTSILLGLMHQKRAGVGQRVWTTMIVGNAYAYSDDFNAYEGKAPLAKPDPEQSTGYTRSTVCMRRGRGGSSSPRRCSPSGRCWRRRWAWPSCSPMGALAIPTHGSPMTAR